MLAFAADLRTNERGRFFPWLAVAMAAGVVAYFALPDEPPRGAGALAFALSAGVALLLRQHFWPRAPALLTAAAALGFASAQLAAWRAPDIIDLPSRATIATGTVRAVETLPLGRRVLLERARLDDGPALKRTLRIRLRGNDTALIATGDTLRIRTLLRPAQPPAYPGAWDLARDAYFDGMGGFGLALGAAERLDQSPPAGFARALQSLRETVTQRVRAVLPGTTGAIATTLLTGSTAPIPDADRAAFRDSGLAHLLAIAGLHIGIVMGFWFGFTRLLLATSEHASLHWPNKQIAAVAALAAGAFYMLLTGGHVPILRSFAMACLVTLAILAGRRALSLRGLALAMAVVILLAPQEVVGVSFQMSFSAVLALIAGYEALRRPLARLRERSWLLHHTAALALTSALAGTASAPFAAYHFGHVQLYYIAANLLAVPLTAALVMPAGMLALLLMPLHQEALALIPMGWGIEAVLWIGRSVSAWPAAVLAVPHIPPWGLAASALGLAWLGIWRTRWRLAGLAALALGLASPRLDPPADILISADARLIAHRAQDGIELREAKGASRFTRDAILAYYGVNTPVPWPVCEGACAVAPGVTLLTADTSPPCDGTLLISAEPVRGACKTAALIDRFTVWRDGAHAIRLSAAGPVVTADRTARGNRPWVAPIPTSTRVPAGNLTLAPADVMPEE
jgi:competence protein ComEC